MDCPKVGNTVKGRTLSEIGTSIGKVSLLESAAISFGWVGRVCVQEIS